MMFMTACGSTQTPTGDASPGTAPDTKTTAPANTDDDEGGKLIVGCPQPLTGTNAMVGDAALKGAQLAVKQINDAGGILGKQLELVVYDDQASPEEAVKIATKMIEVDKVDWICGSLISSCMLAAGQYYEEAGIITFGTGLSSTWMEKDWSYVFRACPNSGFAMPILAQYMKDMGIQKISIFQGQDDSSASGADDMRAACKEIGIEVLTSETYVEGDTDYSGQIGKIINSKPDAVFSSTFSVTQSAFAKQLRQFGYKGLVFNKETLSADNIKVAGDASNYWAFMFPYITYASIEECDVPVIKKFLEAYYEEFNEMPFHDCAYRTYDSMMVMAKAAEIAGTIDSEAVRDAVSTISDFEGLGGTYDFTRGDREGIHSFNAFIVVDEKIVGLDKWIEDGEYEKLKASIG
ncbi:MAG: ABC transporter substrate-binding protein [Christensenellales bacterium]